MRCARANCRRVAPSARISAASRTRSSRVAGRAEASTMIPAKHGKYKEPLNRDADLVKDGLQLRQDRTDIEHRDVRKFPHQRLNRARLIGAHVHRSHECLCTAFERGY